MTTVRTTDDVREALQRLADMKNVSLSAAAESFLPGTRWANLLSDEHADDQDFKAPADPLWTLAHEGLRWRLARLGIPVSEIERLTPPEVLKFYTETRAARNGAIHRIRLADMLRGLRSPEAAERKAAASLLAFSLGRGLAIQGEHPEDIEHTIGPDLCNLLERAAAGDSDAADQLERSITTSPAGA